MGPDRRIWNTAALAVAITLILAFFVFRLGDWSTDSMRALSAAIDPSATRVIPQVVAGTFDGGATRYQTVIQIVNEGDRAVDLGVRFFAQDGTPSPLSFSAGLTGETFEGVLEYVHLPAGAILAISGSSGEAGVIAWGKIESTAQVHVTSVLELRFAATNLLVWRTAVPAATPNLSRFLIPRVRNVASGLDVAFAVVNAAGEAAAIRATLFDAFGRSVASREMTFEARQQMALFTREFFEIGEEPVGTSQSYIVFESDKPQFAATALAFEGLIQTSLPVQRLQ